MRFRRAPLLALALAVLGLGASRALAEEPRPEARAWVAITAARDTAWVGEPVTLRLEIGLDDAWFGEHAVPLVRQRMDLPVIVLAPGLAALPGTVRRAPRPAPDAEPHPRRLVMNDEPAWAESVPSVERDGRTFSVHRIEVDVLPAEPGVLVVPPPTLRFAYATRFEHTFAAERLPLDRTEGRVAGPAPTITVRALPTEGRPEGFSGAVGRFAMQATLDPSPAADGKGVRLLLRIEGEGNLEVFDTPRLEGLDGFHVYGALDDRARPVRRIRYDLAPVRDGLREVPPIALATFDPTPPAGYRTVTTAAVALPTPTRVAGQPGRGTGAAGGEAGGRDSGTGGSRADEARRGGRLVLAVAAAVAILSALSYGLLRRRRARAATDVDATQARLRAALVGLRAAAALPGVDPADAFAEVLAARLTCPPAAVIAPDLAARLAAVGVEPTVAARAAAALERLVGARYGGGAAVDTPHDLLVLAERIAASTGAHGAPPRGR